MDNNGDLGGAWQLLSWQDAETGDIVAEKSARIYYYFSRQLLRMQRLDEAFYYLSTFHRAADSLFLDAVYSSPYDSTATYTDLAPYGVSSTGRFRIVSLSGNSLVLSNEKSLLTFRKY